MNSHVNRESRPELHSVESSEMQAVSGGYDLFVDVGGMPNRTETCGTMWVLDQFFKGIFGRSTPWM